MTRLVHPETGGEFDAPERSVPVWVRSGWTPKPAPAGAGSNSSKSTAGTTAPDSQQENK